MSFKPPKEFIPGNNPAEVWKKWKENYQMYCIAAEMDKKSEMQKKAILLYTVGEVGQQIYNTHNFNKDMKDVTSEDILEIITKYYTPYKNTTFLRYKFFTAIQTETQNVDDFVANLKIKAKDCEFGALEDGLIKDRLICGIRDDTLRKRLLREHELTLSRAVDICRSDETSRIQMKDMSYTEVKVEALKKYKNNNHKNNQNIGKTCSRCLTSHSFGQCPAWKRQCNKCKKFNHFAKACKTKHKVREIEEKDQNSEEEFLEVKTITMVSQLQMFNKNKTKTREWKQKIVINKTKIEFKIDTGSEVNILPFKIFNDLKDKPAIMKTKKSLVSYTNNKLKTIGVCKLKCKLKDKNQVIEFYIIQENNQPILGLNACINLNLIERVYEIDNDACSTENHNIIKSAEDIIMKFGKVFEGVGCVKKEYNIRLKPNAEAQVSSSRKIPVALREPVKTELERLEKLGIIAKVSEPTEWVHPIVVVEKGRKGVRICMDPRPLNKFIMREHYELPTLETVQTSLKGANYFTVMDVSNAFHQIPLGEESSKLCTVITPFGRYRFKRLPFGISSATEVFQKFMNEMIEGMEGIIVYTDDILIYGKTIQEHNKRLSEFLQRALDNNLKLKKDKLQLAVNKINYLGCTISKDGVSISDNKIEAIQNMKRPTNKKELQSFLGVMNYFGRFIDNLSQNTGVLRELLKKNNEWIWEENGPHEQCFKNLKKLITEAPVLAFFDPTKDTTLAADASQYGLGGVIIQDDHPVAYHSTSLTSAQKNYAQIEKELLAIVIACKNFHYYIYGKPVTILTDHKPLIGIINKSLDSLSPRLQRMTMQLLRYQVELKYIPGKVNFVADLLSRNPRDSHVETNYLENLTVHGLLIASDEKIKKFKEETAQDFELQQLRQIIKQGWPRHKADVPSNLKPYYEHRLEIYFQDGLLYKGKSLIIPTKQRLDMIKQIHKAHQGIGSSLKRAKEAVFWPGMSKHICDYVSNCLTCQRYSRANIKQPMKPYPVPKLPWQEIAADFFQAKGNSYLLVTDYYSKFIELISINSKTANSVISKLKSVFSTHGVPLIFHSDNGPPFDSKEFKSFLHLWDIKHTTSSPLYPKSNGLVERHVQTIEALLKKSEEDPELVTLVYNTTPKFNLPAPCEMLMGRMLRSNIPSSDSYLKPKFDTTRIFNTLKNNQCNQKRYYDQHSKSLPSIGIGQPVLLQKDIRNWIPAEVTKIDDRPDSYWVKTDEGKEYRRNRSFLRIRKDVPAVETLDDAEDSNEEAENRKTVEEHLDRADPEIQPEITTTPRRTSSRGRKIFTPVKLKDYYLQ